LEIKCPVHGYSRFLLRKIGNFWTCRPRGALKFGYDRCPRVRQRVKVSPFTRWSEQPLRLGWLRFWWPRIASWKKASSAIPLPVQTSYDFIVGSVHSTPHRWLKPPVMIVCRLQPCTLFDTHQTCDFRKTWYLFSSRHCAFRSKSGLKNLYWPSQFISGPSHHPYIHQTYNFQ
jgi:hypothetical protein